MRPGNRSQITRSRIPGTAAAMARQISTGCSRPRNVLAEPIQTRSAQAAQGLVIRHRVALGVDAGRDHVDVFDPRPARRAQSARKSLPATIVSARR